jgi:Lon protease-like protein
MSTSMEITGPALERLALFPLPDVVLFPGTLLPLHIFEPRYREMMADVLTGARVMGVVRLRPGYESDYEGRPPIHDTLGVGYVVQHDRLPDGRYNLMLRGVARVLLEEELPSAKAYREARTRVLVDTHSSRPELAAERHKTLVALCDQLAARIPEGGDSVRQVVRAFDSPGACADVVASAIVRDPDARQALLELLDPADRLEKVLEVVSAFLLRFDPGGMTN